MIPKSSKKRQVITGGHWPSQIVSKNKWQCIWQWPGIADNIGKCFDILNYDERGKK